MVGDPGIEPGVRLREGVTVPCHTLRPVAHCSSRKESDRLSTIHEQVGQQENVALYPKFVKPVQSLTNLEIQDTCLPCSFGSNGLVHRIKAVVLFVSV